MQVIAKLETDFDEKFGIPRQSGLISDLKGRLVMEPKYRNPDAFRGIEDYDYLWLLWKSGTEDLKTWSATVKPPRLGGNKKMGVFATRSPFRPNPICMSLVKLDGFALEEEGPVLYVSGVDMMNQTEIYDIKPYLVYADSRPNAKCGFSDDVLDYELKVVFPLTLLEVLPEDKRNAAVEILKQDPRPSYQDDSSRRYGIAFAGYDIRFHVADGVLTVCEVVKL